MFKTEVDVFLLNNNFQNDVYKTFHCFNTYTLKYLNIQFACNNFMSILINIRLKYKLFNFLIRTKYEY